MSETKDRSDASKAKSFDEAWDSLLDPPSGDEGGTKAWTEEVRGANKRKDEPAEPEDAAPERTDETKAWTEEVRGARKQDGAATPEPAVPKADEMDRIMREEPVGEVPEEEIPPSASTSMMSFDALDLPERAKPDESLMEALMGSEPAPESVEESAPDPTDDEQLSPPIVLHPNRSVAKPEPEPVGVEPLAKPRSKRLPLIVGGTVAAGLALWLGREPDPKPATGAGTDPVAAALETKSLGPAIPATLDVPPESRLDLGSPEPEDARTPPVPDPNRDPREPPPGTPEEIAEVFTRLPVSPADRAPVGGVGKTGIHVDDVSVGNVYDRSRCSGGSGSFSVSQGDRVNVCLRVVHQREKEELSVVWQKVDGNARRGKIVIKPLHAYRTRAYLKLRSEYVGDWEVKIFSDDGVELARYPFTVVP